MNQEEFNDMQLKKLSDVRREYAEKHRVWSIVFLRLFPDGSGEVVVENGNNETYRAFEFDYFQDFVDWVYL